LTADLQTLGYTEQTSVDFSEVVIDAMKTKYSALETRWCVMDVRELQLPDNSAEVAIDKGTLDAMIHGSLWDPPDDVRSNVGRYIKEVQAHFNSQMCPDADLPTGRACLKTWRSMALHYLSTATLYKAVAYAGGLVDLVRRSFRRLQRSRCV
jgi:Methyltransferase domain